MANRYWIGGTGNWSDYTHWSYTSGGSGGSIGVADSYSESNQTSYFQIQPTSRIGAGQSFTGDGKTVETVKFYLQKVNSPTGNICAKIYSEQHATAFGTDSVTNTLLATSDSYDVSTITASFTLITFTFSGSNRITLTNGTKYCVMCENVDLTGASTGINIGYDDTSPTHSGNYIQNWFGTSADATKDTCFYLYTSTPVPTSTDDVFIDSSSGFGSGGTITLTESSYCKDFVSNSGHTYTLGGNNFIISGSIILESGMTIDSSEVILTSFADELITSGGYTMNSNSSLSIIGTGSWTMQDDLSVTSFYQESGTFDASGFNITADSFYFLAYTGHAPTVNMNTGTWEVTGTAECWEIDQFDGQVVTLNASTSTLKFTDATTNTKFMYLGSGDVAEAHTYYNLWIACGGSKFEIYGSNTFNEIKVTGDIDQLNLEGSGTTTVSSFILSGTISKTIYLDTTSGSVGQHILSKASGVVVCDYLNISNSNATGGATWYAGSHSTNTTNNTGWIFSDPPPPPKMGFVNFQNPGTF